MTVRLRAAHQLVDFDSGVNMVRALGRFLRGRGHGGLSVGPSSRWLADAASSVPTGLRRRVFPAAALGQALPLHRAACIDADAIAEWVVRQYPPGPHRVVAVGAASGAALHLAAALRAPYLPQTTLVAVRDLATHPDDPQTAMRALAPTTATVARHNPDVAVYHMHDPAQDRPMLESMAYLRLKRQRLGRTYERFLEHHLAPGGTILVLDCSRTWRSAQTGERAYFQFGCLGGVPEEEYHGGGDRIADYLARERSPWSRWDPPATDGRRPEAEWGFDSQMLPELERVADRFGYQLRRLVVDEPQQGSPLVSDLYRWWYRRHGLTGQRLLVESYVQCDPLWVMRLGAVPFWMRFNMGTDYVELEQYLSTAERYDHIHINLFSQGLWSPGVVPVERWQRLVESAADQVGEIIGVDTNAYPLDAGSSMRFQRAFQSLPPRHPVLPPLTVDDIELFVDGHTAEYGRLWR